MSCNLADLTRRDILAGAASSECREYLVEFIRLSIAVALTGGESEDLEPERQMNLLHEAEVYSLPLQMAGNDEKAETRQLLASLYRSMAVAEASGRVGSPSQARSKVEMYVERALGIDPNDEESRSLLPHLLAQLEVASRKPATKVESVTESRTVEGKETANIERKRVSNWIDVVKYAETIEGWKISFEELLQLAKVLNATVVEPCMQHGRLHSCAKHGVPLGDIFDLKDEMTPLTPLVASYKEYAQSVRHKEHRRYKICVDRSGTLASCQASDTLVRQVNKTQLLEELGANGTVVLQLENYWWGSSVYDVGEHFGVTVPYTQRRRSDHYSFANEGRLSFHPERLRAVSGALHDVGIDMDSFSAIHWQLGDGEGMEEYYIDYQGCAKAL